VKKAYGRTKPSKHRPRQAAPVVSIDPNAVYSEPEAAAILKLRPRTLRALRLSGREPGLVASRAGHRRVVYLGSALLDYLRPKKAEI
jgi:hypothetical protein